MGPLLALASAASCPAAPPFTTITFLGRLGGLLLTGAAALLLPQPRTSSTKRWAARWASSCRSALWPA